MIKWTISYTTYNDEKVTEDFYFHLNKAELAQMQFNVNGAYSNFIERLQNERDLKGLGDEFRNLILSSYGKKSDDGRIFRKTKEIREEFEFSEAFSELYMELLSDADKATKFARGILPTDLQGASIEAKLATVD